MNQLFFAYLRLATYWKIMVFPLDFSVMGHESCQRIVTFHHHQLRSFSVEGFDPRPCQLVDAPGEEVRKQKFFPQVQWQPRAFLHKNDEIAVLV